MTTHRHGYWFLNTVYNAFEYGIYNAFERKVKHFNTVTFLAVLDKKQELMTTDVYADWKKQQRSDV